MGRLVLSRRAGQSVKVGEQLVLTIREVHPKKVYLSAGAKPVWITLGEQVPMPEGLGELTIAEINKGHVKLLFDADRSVTIVRSELLP